MSAAGAAAVLGSAWGATLLARPDALVELVSGRRPTDAERTVAQVLGGRQVVQAAAVARWPHRGGRLAALADTLHAVSMVVLAVFSPRHRRAGLVSGGVAVLLAVLERKGSTS
jgi:uncharacterized membrane protein